MGEKNLKIGYFSLLCSLCCQWRDNLSSSPHGSLEVIWQHNTEMIYFPQIFVHIRGDRGCAVDRFWGCKKWALQVHSPDVPQKNPMQQDVHQSHLKLVLKRIKWEKITSKTEEKGRKENKTKKGNEWRKRKGARQNFWVWVTLLIKFSAKFKNPTAFYL